MIKSNNKIHYLIYITIFLHAILINLHPVNFEYVFFNTILLMIILTKI